MKSKGKLEKVREVAKEAAKEALEQAFQDAEEEVFGDKPPGTVMDLGKPNARKVPYTKAWLESNYPMVTIIPDETRPVTWNGVSYQLISGEEITVPLPIKGVYDDARKLQSRGGRSRFVTATGDTVNVSPGAGALEPEVYKEA